MEKLNSTIQLLNKPKVNLLHVKHFFLAEEKKIFSSSFLSSYKLNLWVKQGHQTFLFVN